MQIKLNSIVRGFVNHKLVMFKVNGLDSNGNVYFQSYYGKDDTERWKYSKIYGQTKKQFERAKWQVLS